MELEEILERMKNHSTSSCVSGETPESSRDSDVCPICHGSEWILVKKNGVEAAKPCLLICDLKSDFFQFTDNLYHISLTSLCQVFAPVSPAQVSCYLLHSWQKKKHAQNRTCHNDHPIIFVG